MDLPSFVSPTPGEVSATAGSMSVGTGTIVAAFVQPRAARDAIVGIHGDALKVKVSAPPADGRANRAVERLLADRLDVASAAVSVISEAGSRSKRIFIRGLDPATVARRLLPGDA